MDPLPRQSTPYILYLVHTHSDNIEILQAIIDTLAKDLDVWQLQIYTFFKASDQLICHIREAHSNMWQKIRSIWANAHDNYISLIISTCKKIILLDYFLMISVGCNSRYNDTSLIVNNLRAYLSRSEIQKTLNGTKGKWELLLGMPYDRRSNLRAFETYLVVGCWYKLNWAAL